MNILNIGSLNIDYFYRVPHFVQPGETLSSTSFEQLAGGKGCNQSLALARAGATVHHVGHIGQDGLFLRELLASEQVNVDNVTVSSIPTGHTVIQVTPEGENAILLYPGANHTFLETEIDDLFKYYSDVPAHSSTSLREAVIASPRSGRGNPASMLKRTLNWIASPSFGRLAMTGLRGKKNFSELKARQLLNETLLLIQNETNLVAHALEQAAQHQLKIFFNPAPFTPEVMNYPLEKVYCLILNDTEAQHLTGQTTVSAIFNHLRKTFPDTYFLLTLGSQGVYGWFEEQEVRQEIIPTTVVDTTAAGDTFIGYFIASHYHHKLSVQESLYIACKAASLCVSRPGAAQSIPRWVELERNFPYRD